MGAALLIAGVLIVWALRKPDKAKKEPDIVDYLRALSIEWKTRLGVAAEINKRKGGDLDFEAMVWTMDVLADLRLIEMNIRLSVPTDIGYENGKRVECYRFTTRGMDATSWLRNNGPTPEWLPKLRERIEKKKSKK